MGGVEDGVEFGGAGVEGEGCVSVWEVELVTRVHSIPYSNAMLHAQKTS